MIDQTDGAADVERMNRWSWSVIEAAKQRMISSQHYLVIADGLPWFRESVDHKSGDVWVDDAWWIDAATARYVRYKSSTLYYTHALDVLIRYFPDKYREEARAQISQWWSKEGNHDPEYWWDLGVKVWPDHPMFKCLYECPENDYEWAVLAYLDYKDSRKQLYEELVGRMEEENDYFWVNRIIQHLANRGGQALVSAVVPAKQLSSIREVLLDYSRKVIDSAVLSEADVGDTLCVQEGALPIAIYLEWPEIIDALAQNRGYQQHLNAMNIAWWSLTSYPQVVQAFVSRHQPYETESTVGADFVAQKLSLAIAWTRIMAQHRSGN